MNFSQVIILGFVQGLTEFLPISSTAHLILLPWFFGWPDPGLIFDISLHFGTLLAILIYFREDWKGMFLADRRTPRLLILLLIATLPGLIFGFLFESWAETVFRSPLLIALTLAVFGLILFRLDRRALSNLGDLSDLNKKQAFFISKKEALLIGLWQALAIIPGVSRSGASISGGLAVGLKRELAVKFSFLLSAPIIAGSAMVGLLKISNIKYQISNMELILGVLTSFAAGLMAIKFLLKFVKTYSFLPFVIYRLILAGLIIIWWGWR